MKASSFKIDILHGRKGAAEARGVAVIIDVLRAFTTACFVISAGVRRLWAVADTVTAQQLAQRNPGSILIGERGGRRIPGFDFGNSPSQIRRVDWIGRTVIFTTTNGTQGLMAAGHAEQVLTGSFVNAGAIVDYIRCGRPSAVSLVCMGSDDRPALEDTLCAEYLQAALMGSRPDFAPIRQKILKSAAATCFLDASHADMPSEDLDLCLIVDRFGFVLRAEKGPGQSVALVRVDPK